MKPVSHCVKPQSGSALLTCLLLTLLITLVSAFAIRTALLEARLIFAVSERERLFNAAERGVAQALNYARDNNLPASGNSVYPPLHEATGNLTTEVEIVALQSDSNCAGISGTRSHYEITSVAKSTAGGRRLHRQGFFICREDCAAGCTAVETRPVRSYWSTAVAVP